MMNNEFFIRMKKLLNNANIKIDENSNDYSSVEFYCYCIELDNIKNYYEQCLKNLFINEADDWIIKKYSILFDFDTKNKSIDELKNMLINRINEKFMPYTKTKFDEEFKKVCSGTYKLDVGKMIISNPSYNDLFKLGQFIKYYIIPTTEVIFEYDGMDFDSWDKWNKSFIEYDKMDLPISIIENLRSELIE